jgi:hypothetical protein
MAAVDGSPLHVGPLRRLTRDGRSGPQWSECQAHSAGFAVIVIVFVAIGMAVVIVVIVVMVMRVIARRWAALTGRLGCHSTAGLTVVAAAVLPLSQLDEIVRHDHSQLRRERRIVGRPVGESGSEAGFWSRVTFGHAVEFMPFAVGPPDLDRNRPSRVSRAAPRRPGATRHEEGQAWVGPSALARRLGSRRHRDAHGSWRPRYAESPTPPGRR